MRSGAGPARVRAGGTSVCGVARGPARMRVASRRRCVRPHASTAYAPRTAKVEVPLHCSGGTPPLQPRPAPGGSSDRPVVPRQRDRRVPAAAPEGRGAQLRRPAHGRPRGLRGARRGGLPGGRRPTRGRRHRHAVPELPHPQAPLRERLRGRGQRPVPGRGGGRRPGAVGGADDMARPVRRLHGDQAGRPGGAQRRVGDLHRLPRVDVRGRRPAVRAGPAGRRGPHGHGPSSTCCAWSRASPRRPSTTTPSATGSCPSHSTGCAHPADLPGAMGVPPEGVPAAGKVPRKEAGIATPSLPTPCSFTPITSTGRTLSSTRVPENRLLRLAHDGRDVDHGHVDALGSQRPCGMQE